MRVSFKYSQEDLVDATVRFGARSKAIKSIRQRNLLWTVVLFFGVALLLLKVSLTMGISLAISTVVVAIIYPYLFAHRYRANVRKIFKEQLGEENEFICNVELSPEGLKSSGQNCEAVAEWNTIDEIVPTNDSVDIFGRKGGGCIVRNRAFTSPEERQTFIDLARDYMNNARGSAQT